MVVLVLSLGYNLAVSGGSALLCKNKGDACGEIAVGTVLSFGGQFAEFLAAAINLLVAGKAW